MSKYHDTYSYKTHKPRSRSGDFDVSRPSAIPEIYRV